MMKMLKPMLSASSTASKRFGDPTRGSRHERGYGSAWDKLRPRILARDCHLCQPCKVAGRLTVGRIVDHKTPKSEGGTDEPGNLQTICHACHTAKTAAEAARGRRGGG